MNEKKPEILRMYEEKRYDISSDWIMIDNDKDVYDALVKYFNKETSFEKLMKEIDGCCPPNSCHWCTDCCDNCDLRNINMPLKCEICWKRCLERY